MILFNFSHPMTEAQLARVADLVGQAPTQIIEIMPQFDTARSFEEQVRKLVDGIALSPQQWQTTPLLVNPPGLAAAAVTLMAELHGRTGYFPPIVRIRPIAGSLPTQFEVAEIVNLQEVRDTARTHRQLVT